MQHESEWQQDSESSTHSQRYTSKQNGTQVLSLNDLTDDQTNKSITLPEKISIYEMSLQSQGTFQQDPYQQEDGIVSNSTIFNNTSQTQSNENATIQVQERPPNLIVGVGVTLDGLGSEQQEYSEYETQIGGNTTWQKQSVGVGPLNVFNSLPSLGISIKSTLPISQQNWSLQQSLLDSQQSQYEIIEIWVGLAQKSYQFTFCPKYLVKKGDLFLPYYCLEMAQGKDYEQYFTFFFVMRKNGEKIKALMFEEKINSLEDIVEIQMNESTKTVNVTKLTPYQKLPLFIRLYPYKNCSMFHFPPQSKLCLEDQSQNLIVRHLSPPEWKEYFFANWRSTN